MRYKYRMASVRQMALKISVTSARFGIVKLRESPPFSRRKRSALERRINNLETAMKNQEGAQTVNLTAPMKPIKIKVKVVSERRKPINVKETDKRIG